MSSYYLSKDFSGSFSASFPSFYLLNSDVSQDTVLGLLPFVLDSPTILWAPAASEPSMGPPNHISSHYVSIKHWYSFELLSSHFHLGFLTDLTRYSRSEYQHPSHKLLCLCSLSAN